MSESYEKYIQELKMSLDQVNNDKERLLDELTQKENSLKSAHGSTQTALDSFKAELRSRDEMIEKLRNELLSIEEKRDINFAEVMNDKITTTKSYFISYLVCMIQYSIIIT